MTIFIQTKPDTWDTQVVDDRITRPQRLTQALYGKDLFLTFIFIRATTIHLILTMHQPTPSLPYPGLMNMIRLDKPVLARARLDVYQAELVRLCQRVMEVAPLLSATCVQMQSVPPVMVMVQVSVTRVSVQPVDQLKNLEVVVLVNLDTLERLLMINVSRAIRIEPVAIQEV